MTKEELIAFFKDNLTIEAEKYFECQPLVYSDKGIDISIKLNGEKISSCRVSLKRF